jgi:hypothetical protein
MDLNELKKSSVSKWISTSTIEDIEAAIEFGIPAVQRLKKLSVHQSIQQSPSQLQPVMQGQTGEHQIENILRDAFGDVSNVSKTPQSGDINLFIKHSKITIEVKNYTNPVPVSGVEKFRRDLHTSGSSGGLFISLNTPITGIASNFTVMYEHIDTGIIPCAYIVSNDKQSIILAVNIVSSLIEAVKFMSSTLYDKDKVLSNIYDVSEQLESMSKFRNDMQTIISNINLQLVKNSTGLVSVEAGIRRAVVNIKQELGYAQITTGGAFIELESNAMFQKHSAELKELTKKIITVIDQTVQKQITPSWKVSARKCANLSCGISLSFAVSKIVVSVPRSRVDPEKIISLLNSLNGKITVDACVNIELDKTTFDTISELISVS